MTFPSTPNANGANAGFNNMHQMQQNLGLQNPNGMYPMNPQQQFGGMQPTYPQYMSNGESYPMPGMNSPYGAQYPHNMMMPNQQGGGGQGVGMMSPGGGKGATFDKGNEEYYNNQEYGQSINNPQISIDPNTRVNFMKNYVIKAYDSDLKEFTCTRKWCFRASNYCETGSLVAMGAAAIFAFIGSQGSPIWSLFAGIISTVGIVLKGFSHHASQEAKESSIKLNNLLKVLNLQGLNVLVNDSGEQAV
eukprot:gene27696-34459_t